MVKVVMNITIDTSINGTPIKVVEMEHPVHGDKFIGRLSEGKGNLERIAARRCGTELEFTWVNLLAQKVSS